MAKISSFSKSFIYICITVKSNNMALKFDKIKSLFIVTEEDTQQKQELEKDNKNVNQSEKNQENQSNKISWKINKNDATNNIQGENSQNIVTDTSGTLNQKIFDSLTQAIANANMPGEDYLEFAQALQAMKDLPIDDNIKIQTVFATLSTKGLTKQTVIESADYYIKVLENEKSKFYDTMNHQALGQLNKKRMEITKLEEEIKAKTEQIQILTEEINQNKQLVIKVKNEIQEGDSKIKKTENDFLFTFDIILKQIKANVEKITKL